MTNSELLIILCGVQKQVRDLEKRLDKLEELHKDSK